MWSALWCFSEVFTTQFELEGQFSNLHKLAKVHEDGDGPLSLLPVVGRFATHSEGRVVLRRVIEHGLEVSRTHVVTIAVARD